MSNESDLIDYEALQAEIERLRARNANLLAALKEAEMLPFPWTGRVRKQMRAAITEAEET